MKYKDPGSLRISVLSIILLTSNTVTLYLKHTIQPKIFKIEIFCGFHGSEYGCENFLSQNFKLITDTVHGWKLDHENFIRERVVFEQNLVKPLYCVQLPLKFMQALQA